MDSDRLVAKASCINLLFSGFSNRLLLFNLIGQLLGRGENFNGCLVFKDVSLRAGENLENLILDRFQLLLVLCRLQSQQQCVHKIMLP